jgi:hypothetical protein
MYHVTRVFLGPITGTKAKTPFWLYGNLEYLASRDSEVRMWNERVRNPDQDSTQVQEIENVRYVE